MGRPRKYHRHRAASPAERAAAYRARRRVKAYHRSQSQTWATPRALFEALEAEFGFTLDPCASAGNACAPLFYSVENDGLTQPWGTEIVFCNPPYNNIAAWVRKAIEASGQGAVVVLLLPVRTGMRWFRELQAAGAEIRYVEGRIRFTGAKNSAPFDSMIAVLKSAP
jgi:site-specific DNA-methyltransferase (adenine-specific)